MVVNGLISKQKKQIALRVSCRGQKSEPAARNIDGASGALISMERVCGYTWACITPAREGRLCHLVPQGHLTNNFWLESGLMNDFDKLQTRFPPRAFPSLATASNAYVIAELCVYFLCCLGQGPVTRQYFTLAESLLLSASRFAVAVVSKAVWTFTTFEEDVHLLLASVFNSRPSLDFTTDSDIGPQMGLSIPNLALWCFWLNSNRPHALLHRIIISL